MPGKGDEINYFSKIFDSAVWFKKGELRRFPVLFLIYLPCFSKPARLLPYRVVLLLPNRQQMLELKDIETAVLFTMLAAHSASYQKFLTKKEAAGCKRTITRLQSEIKLRQKGSTGIAIGKPSINVVQLASNR